MKKYTEKESHLPSKHLNWNIFVTICISNEYQRNSHGALTADLFLSHFAMFFNLLTPLFRTVITFCKYGDCVIWSWSQSLFTHWYISCLFHFCLLKWCSRYKIHINFTCVLSAYYFHQPFSSLGNLGKGINVICCM